MPNAKVPDDILVFIAFKVVDGERKAFGFWIN